MNYAQNQRSTPYISPDTALDVTEYGVAVAGVLGVDTTRADITLTTGQAIRLLVAPETVEKPRNEKAKLIASGASLLLGEITGNKRGASALGLIAMLAIDAAVRD